ncbi:MAG: Bax inhibitor-1/YccA family protein [Myxococcota bacterium]
MAPMEPYRSALGRAEASTRSAERAEFFWKTYQWMSLGLGLTGVVAYVVASTPSLVQTFLMNRPLFFGLLIAELGMVWWFSSIAHRISFAKAAAMFLAYAVLNGITFSVLFLVYTEASIFQVFLITGGSFACLSLYGMVTKRDLSPIGQFLFFGLIGIIISSLVNAFFVRSSGLSAIVSYAGVLVFAGLTAYDTQKLKNIYDARGEAGNLALRGALTLYLDFINLFIFLLRILGNQRR